MPIPSFTQTLGSSLGPDITVITGGDLFSENDSDLNIKAMNDEISSLSGKDDIVFLSEKPKEDMPFRKFIESQRK